MSNNISETRRANVYIRATEADGYTVREGARCESFADPYEACEHDERFREAYKRLMAGASAVANGKIKPVEVRQLTPFCRAMSAKFECDGRDTQISIFTEKVGKKEEKTLAVQVTHETEAGQHVELYSRHPRQRRLFDPFVTSSDTFLAVTQGKV